MPYPDGLPAATALANTDEIIVSQGGTAGIPGTATTRRASLTQLLSGPLGGPYLSAAGGVLTGALTLAGAPTAALNAATKAYVDAQVVGVATLHTADVGRNRLMNGQFLVNQRAAVNVTTFGFPVDRWLAQHVNGTRTVSQTVADATARTQIADEEVVSVLNYVTTGGAAAGDYENLSQAVESARTCAGKSMTLSFWAVASTAGKFISVELGQVFGSGGSPSADVPFGATKIALSTTWARYSVTFAVPSVAGKTFGTAGDDKLFVAFWFSAGSTWNARTGTLGPQTIDARLWGVQLEEGAIMTTVEKPSPGVEMANCQRFFQTGSWQLLDYAPAGANSVAYILPLATRMRTAPTIAPVVAASVNCSGTAIVPNGDGFYQVSTISTVTGAFNTYGTFQASADL